MTSWNKYKQTITATSPTEMRKIDTLAYLQSERLRQGVSQHKLARQIGLKQTDVARLERLDAIPSSDILRRYAQGVGVSSLKQ